MSKSKSSRSSKRKKGAVVVRSTAASSDFSVKSSDIPGAVSKVLTSLFRVEQSADGMVVSGRDLVQPLPRSVAINSQNYLFAAIPANPCYWRGTRISALAAAYQCYRPLSLIMRYVPQVAVTREGTVLVGTSWNTPLATESLEQSMVTSNGGAMSQCYNPFSVEIKLGSNLQQNLFTCAGSLDEDHNPFFFLALMRGSDVIPGYFYVEYRYTLRNPLGTAVAYDALHTYAPDYGSVRMDRSVLALAGIPGLAGPGAVFDLEADGELYYNGTNVTIPDGTPVVVYSNNPISVVDPTFTSSIQSIVVLPRAVNEGSSVILEPDRATWNWETDANFATGNYSTAGSTPVSFESNLTTLRIWIENAISTANMYVYALNLATNTIGALITVFRAVAGSRNDPTALLTIQNRDGLTRRSNTGLRIVHPRPPRLRDPPPESSSSSYSAPPIGDGKTPLFSDKY